MGRKRKVNDTFEGLGIKPGDELKIWSGESVIYATAAVRGPVIDFEGDLRATVAWGTDPDDAIYFAPRGVDFIQVVKAAEPPAVPVSRDFGGHLSVTVTGSDLTVNGRVVSETLFLAVGFAADILEDYPGAHACPSSEDLEPSSEDLERAWTNAGCKLSPVGFSAGCACCTHADLQEAVHWVHDQLYGE